MISASIRGDGSSRFAPDTRWGYFPAASLGWRISDENFMRNAKWLNDMKLRVSVGQTGGTPMGTIVNGQKIVRHILRQGDAIAIGNSVLVFNTK